MLRLAHPSPRRRGLRARLRPRQYRCLVPRDRRRGARCHHRQCLGLRHDLEGLRLHAARGPGLVGEGGEGLGARPRRDRGDGRDRPLAPAKFIDAGRLSLRLLDAAWPEAAPSPARSARGGGIRGRGDSRGPSLLRLGRHLQHPAAAIRRAAAPAQDRQYPLHRCGRRGHGQYRLHPAARERVGDSDFAHGRAARLGDRRAEAGGAYITGGTLDDRIGSSAMRDSRSLKSAGEGQSYLPISGSPDSMAAASAAASGRRAWRK